MKRIIIVSLILALLIACVPTPEQEFVVNKADGKAEQKLNEVHSENVQPDGTQQNDEPDVGRRFPDRWKLEETEVQKGTYISANAEIIQKPDDRYPVLRTREASFTTDEVAEKLALLLPKPKESYAWQGTKAYYADELQKYLDFVEERQRWLIDGIPYSGDGDYVIPTEEEIEENTAELMERIKNAPEALDTQTVSDYSGLSMPAVTFYTLENGESARVYCRQEGWSMYRKMQSETSSVVCAYQVDRENMDYNEIAAQVWQEPTLSSEDAQATAEAAVQRLGYTDFVIQSANPANYVSYHMLAYSEETAEWISSGWSFRFRRDYGNYPTVYEYSIPTDGLNYGTEEDPFARPIPDEWIDVYVDADGVTGFAYISKKEIVGVVNPNVDLLSFDELQTRVLNALGACLTGSRLREHSNRFEIYRMVLTTYTIREKDRDTYLEMPCWFVYFDFPIRNEKFREYYRSDPSGLMQECLILNAVDGSIIDRNRGY